MTTTTPTSSSPARPAPAARRKLHFETLPEAIAEAERLAEAERDGRLDRAGNWALGQTFGHLATWADYAFDGYPPEAQPPWIVRFIARRLKSRILNHGMMPGMKIGRIPGGTLGAEPLPTDIGLARLRSAFGRLGSRAPEAPNPAFGPMSHDEWIRLNLRHAELHLGFQVPR